MACFYPIESYSSGGLLNIVYVFCNMAYQFPDLILGGIAVLIGTSRLKAVFHCDIPFFHFVIIFFILVVHTFTLNGSSIILCDILRYLVL